MKVLEIGIVAEQFEDVIRAVAPDLLDLAADANTIATTPDNFSVHKVGHRRADNRRFVEESLSSVIEESPFVDIMNEYMAFLNLIGSR